MQCKKTKATLKKTFKIPKIITHAVSIDDMSKLKTKGEVLYITI